VLNSVQFFSFVRETSLKGTFRDSSVRFLSTTHFILSGHVGHVSDLRFPILNRFLRQNPWLDRKCVMWIFDPSVGTPIHLSKCLSVSLSVRLTFYFYQTCSIILIIFDILINLNPLLSGPFKILKFQFKSIVNIEEVCD